MRSLLLAILLITAFRASAQNNIKYDVSFPNAVHYEAQISIKVHQSPADSMVFWMSRSSPGRYALHEFAKNVYNVFAVDAQGDTLSLSRPNPYSWKVSGYSDGTVTLTYTLYGHHPDGTYPGIDPTHAHLNMPGTFMWVKGLEKRPITVHFHPPKNSGWKVATQLVPTDDPMTFTAPSRDYFMDSPTELSNYKLRTWTVKSGDRTEKFRLALHFDGTRQEADHYADMAEKVVREEKAIYGELPDYDYGTYTFIADYLPYIYGDGMEHRNSTIISSRQPLKTGALQNLGILAHEFFHCWNMERIRAKAIEPFDFTKADMSKELWFGEGFTSYYDDLTLKRAGFIDDKEYASRIGRAVNYVINAPGRKYFDPVQMSMQAPFVDAATSIDDQNKENTFISYYTWGSVVGLGLDLTLRQKYDLTLDDYMRAMWKKFGKTGKHYTMDDLQETLAEVTGNKTFANNFFRKYINGEQVVNYKNLLAQAGYQLQKAHPGNAVLQLLYNKLSFNNGNATLTANTLVGSPLYNAGIDQDDEIIKIDGHSIRNRRDYERVVQSHKPGDRVSVQYKSSGQIQRADVVFAEDPTLAIVPFKTVGKSLTARQSKFRNAWLGSQQ